MTESVTKMTKARIDQLSRKNNLYLNPKLNDVLYLHFQGFDEIDGLEEFTQLKCLWLDSNAISKIRGLDNQRELKCLFLQNNIIKKIENLEQCRKLDTLNLSHNQIRTVDNCHSDILPELSSLDLSYNYLKSADQMALLGNCNKISVLDLSNNRIDDVLIVKVLGEMENLRVLSMMVNPVISLIPSYRKTMILECRSLTYLDNRPVTEKDRACAEAWKRGGFEAEKKENERWNRENRRKIREDINLLLQKRNERGHNPPFKMINPDSDEESSKDNDQNSMLEQPITDNVKSWKDVENILLNPAIPSYSDVGGILSNRVIELSNCETATDSNQENNNEPEKKNEVHEIVQETHEESSTGNSSALAQDITNNNASDPSNNQEISDQVQEPNAPASNYLEVLEPRFSHAQLSPFISFLNITTVPEDFMETSETERTPIHVASKYVGLQTTVKAENCPENVLASAFIPSPDSIPYDGTVTQFMDDCIRDLEESTRETELQNQMYLQEVDRVFEESIISAQMKDAEPKPEEKEETEILDGFDWVDKFLKKDVSTTDFTNKISSMSGQLQEANKERMNRFREDNLKILEKISGLYDKRDSGSLSNMKTELGAISKVIKDSERTLQNRPLFDFEEMVEKFDFEEQENWEENGNDGKMDEAQDEENEEKTQKDMEVKRELKKKANQEEMIKTEEEIEKESKTKTDEYKKEKNKGMFEGVNMGTNTEVTEKEQENHREEWVAEKEKENETENEQRADMKKLENHIQSDEEHKERLAELIEKYTKDDKPLLVRDIPGGWKEFELQHFGCEIPSEGELSDESD